MSLPLSLLATGLLIPSPMYEKMMNPGQTIAISGPIIGMVIGALMLIL